MVELLTFMVHRRQELERKEAEEELAQAREEEGEKLLQAQQAQSGEEGELQAQARAKLGEENPSHASIPPDEAKETQESGLLPSSKRFKSCF